MLLITGPRLYLLCYMCDNSLYEYQHKQPALLKTYTTKDQTQSHDCEKTIKFKEILEVIRFEMRLVWKLMIEKAKKGSNSARG